MRRISDRQLLKAVAHRIRDARLAKGWSREKVAEVLEVSPETVRRHETGETAATIPMLRRLSRVLSTDLATLLGIKAPELTKEQAQLLEAFGRLTPEQRAILLAVAREMGRRG